MSDEGDEEKEKITSLAFLGILAMLFVYMMLGHFFEHKHVNFP